MKNFYDASGGKRRSGDFIIPALDFETVREARACIETLLPVCVLFKIGKHFILDPDWSKFLTDYFGPKRRNQMFLDLKDFEVGESARLYARQVYNYGDGDARVAISYFTVHAHRDTMTAAVSQRLRGTKILAVPLMTSFGQGQVREEYNWGGSVLDYVLMKTRVVVECGVDGVICSPQEVLSIRDQFGDKLSVVVTGFYPDHARTGTPAQAVKDGADHVVIGRRIIHAANPRDEFEKIAEEIDKVI